MITDRCCSGLDYALMLLLIPIYSIELSDTVVNSNAIGLHEGGSWDNCLGWQNVQICL